MTGSAATPRLALDYRPHAGQRLAHAAFDTARFVVAVCGRRWGKSWAALRELERRALTQPGTVACLASPVYAQARSRFRDFVALTRSLDPRLVANVNRSELRVEFANGSAVSFASVFEPDRLRGGGLDFLVLDEAGYVDAPVWHEVLRPMLADRLGQALVIGTPRGRGQLLHTLYLRGQGEDPDWRSFRFPTSSNPLIARSELEAARAELPEDVWRQEYCGEFLDSAAGVFRGIAGCVGGHLAGPVGGRRYIAGVDLAQTQDWSVIVVLDDRRQVVELQRFRRVSYVDQVSRILTTAQHYNGADVVVDETGVGRPVLDALRAALGFSRTDEAVDRRGGLRGRRPRITGVTLTSQTKQDVIQRLQLDLERGRIRIPAECDVMLRELELYGYEMLPSGRISYSAPAGHHDDTVIALALAAFGIPREGFGRRGIPDRWAGLIERLRPLVSQPQRYNLPRRRWSMLHGAPGTFVQGPLTRDLFAEVRLLQACHAAGLVADDEAMVHADRLRRQIHGDRHHAALVSTSTDGLDREFGTLHDFMEGRVPWKEDSCPARRTSD